MSEQHVPLSVYESAVKGRQDMRAALRDKRRQADKYGVALMMIREGCADPAGFAARVLAEFESQSEAPFFECPHCGADLAVQTHKTECERG